MKSNKKSTAKQDAEIVRLFNAGMPQTHIAKKFGFKRGVVRRVLAVAFGHVPRPRHSAGRCWAGKNYVNPDEVMRQARAAEKHLPPDNRTMWEQWMPRPGRSALDDKLREPEKPRYVISAYEAKRMDSNEVA